MPGLFVLGLAISVVMLVRTQVGGDAVCLLQRGWLLAEKGIWVPLGNPASSAAGGYVPGGLTALLTGLPLMVFMDHRAPVIPILLFHVIAYLLLDRVVKDALGNRARFALAILFWLNPWRVWQSGWVDNSNYVFLTGAVHLWALWRQRERPSFVGSAVLVATVGLSFQLHLDAALLVIAAVLFWWRGYWKPHWRGAALGAAVAVAALVPFFLEAARHPEVWPGSGGDNFVGSGLARGWPPFKGLLYWFRYPSLSVAAPMANLDFTPAFGAAADRVLAPIWVFMIEIVGPATALFAVIATVWAWRRRRTPPDRPGPTEWLLGYAGWTCAAGFIANSISTTAVMWWHNLIYLHAAILPVILWTEHVRGGPRARLAVRLMTGYLVLSVVVVLGMAFASGQYRFGGRDRVRVVVGGDHEMLRDLRLTERGFVRIRPGRKPWPRSERFFYRTYMRQYSIAPGGNGIERADPREQR